MGSYCRDCAYIHFTVGEVLANSSRTSDGWSNRNKQARGAQEGYLALSGVYFRISNLQSVTDDPGCNFSKGS